MRGVSACAVICSGNGSASAVGLVFGCRSSAWIDDMGIPSNRGCMHGAMDMDLMARQGRHAPPYPYRNKGREGGHLNLMDGCRWVHPHPQRRIQEEG